MFTTFKLHKLTKSIVIFALFFSAISSTAVSAQGGDGAKRQVNTQNGKIHFIGPESGRAVPASRVLGGSYRPQDPGMALAMRFGPEFGLKDPGRELSVMKNNHPGNGRVTVRYQQQYQGIPVVGGELIVNTNENGDLYSIIGEVSPDLSLLTQPTIDMTQAAENARQAVAKWYQDSPQGFVSSEPELWIYDESLLQPSTRPVELVWRMEVTAKDYGMPVRELVLVNAQTGTISLHFNQIDTAWQADGMNENAHTNTNMLPYYAGHAVLGTPLVSTYTASNNSSLPGNLLCNQTQPNCTNGANQHADAAHKHALGTYSLYATQHLRDSINNKGMTIISTVQYCNIDPNVPCPYASAFWSGFQMVYGSKYGFALADDIVAHELTHGVTQFESNLFSFYQSGAIDESFSDLWGEYYDQTNGLGNDTAAVKWLIGEDVGGLRVVRSMKNPPSYGDPDKMKSSLYQKNVNDNGGIHHNSGVNNKAIYLMVDGGTFNKKTVTPLGWNKVAAIYYEVNTNMLTSGSDYSDLYYALQQACTILTETTDISAADCLEVKDALDAVQMNSQPAKSFNPDAPMCPSGTITDPSLTVFKDDLEDGLGNWSTSGLAWSLTFDKYASSGTNSLWGTDANLYTDARATLMTAVPIPAGRPFLYFKHAFLFDYTVYQSMPRYYDGGVLEYSTDGGSTWVDAKPLYSAGKNYGPALYKSSGNILGGRMAFVGDSHGYVSSRYNLKSLAGKLVQFRWRLATDKAVDLMGWYLDDVQIYTCIPVPAIPTLLSPAMDALLTSYTPLLDWSDTLSGLDHYQVQVDEEITFTSPLYDVNTLVSEYQLPSVAPNTKYYWRVRSFNSLGATLGWSKVRYFRAAILPPVLTAPNDLAVLTIRRPLFDWENVDGATGYRIVISKNANVSNPIRSVSVTSSQYLPAADLPANTVLYWRVRATGPNGPSLWSAKLSFTTGNPPSTPTLLLPAKNVLVTTYPLLFDWSDSTLPDTTIFKHYELQVDNNNDFTSPEILVNTPDGVITESSFTLSTSLTPNTKYYWRVRATNDVGGVEHFSSWSAVRSFRTVMAPPTLLLPADKSTVSTLKPIFDWNDVAGASSYTFQVSASMGFETLLVNTSVTASTFTPFTNLPNNKTLYWRVQANGTNGPSAWSMFEFTTPP